MTPHKEPSTIIRKNINLNSKSEILLITYEYPFGASEAFIETEIKYLSAEFSKVWVMPSRCFWSLSHSRKPNQNHRKIPQNCVLLTPKEAFTKNRFFGSVKALSLFFKANYKSLLNSPNLIGFKYIISEVIQSAILYPHAKAILNKNPNITLAYSYWKSPAATAVALLRQRGELAKGVTRCHGGDLYLERLNYPYRPFDNYVFQLIDFIIPISNDGKSYLIQHGAPKNKVLLGRLGVTISDETSSASTDGVLRIATCSNLIPLKRVDMLAEALCNVSFNFEWVHFGDGPEKDRIVEIQSRFPKSGKAVFMGKVPNSQILDYYKNHSIDIFINISESEGVPVSIMEALGAGIPCLATDVGGTAEILDKSCGQLIDKELTPGELEKILTKIYENINEWTAKREYAKSKGRLICDAKINYSTFSKFLSTCHKQEAWLAGSLDN